MLCCSTCWLSLCWANEWLLLLLSQATRVVRSVASSTMSVTFAGGRRGWATTIQCQLCKTYEHEHASHFAYLSVNNSGDWEFASLRDADLEILMARIEAEETAKASGAELNLTELETVKCRRRLGQKEVVQACFKCCGLKLHQNETEFTKVADGPAVPNNRFKKICLKTMRVKQVVKLWKTCWAVWSEHLDKKEQRNYVWTWLHFGTPVCQRRQTGCRSCPALKWKPRCWIVSYSTLARFVTCSLLVRPTGTCWSRHTPTVTPGLVLAAATNGVGVPGRGSWWWKSMVERRQFCVRSHRRCQLSSRTSWACCGWCMWPASWSLKTCPPNRFLQRLEIWQLGQNNDWRCTPPCSSKRLHLSIRSAFMHPGWSVSMRHCPYGGQGKCFRLWKCLVLSLGSTWRPWSRSFYWLQALLTWRWCVSIRRWARKRKEPWTPWSRTALRPWQRCERLMSWKNIHMVEDVTHFCGWHDAWGKPERSLSWVTLLLFAKSHCIGSLKFGCAKGELIRLSA